MRRIVVVVWASATWAVSTFQGDSAGREATRTAEVTGRRRVTRRWRVTGTAEGNRAVLVTGTVEGAMTAEMTGTAGVTEVTEWAEGDGEG